MPAPIVVRGIAKATPVRRSDMQRVLTLAVIGDWVKAGRMGLALGLEGPSLGLGGPSIESDMTLSRPKWAFSRSQLEGPLLVWEGPL